MTDTPFQPHDHDQCRSHALTELEARCEKANLQLTPMRRKVFEILSREHRALGAYDILSILQEEGVKAQPPAAYRALDFLIQAGAVHRIERMNAFVACSHPDESHDPAFLICRECASVSETVSKTQDGALAKSARAAGFKVEQTMLEAEGICPNCQDQSGT